MIELLPCKNHHDLRTVGEYKWTKSYSTFNDLECFKPSNDTRLIVTTPENPISYLATFAVSEGFWIVTFSCCPAIIEKAVRFEIDRVWKITPT